MKRTSKKRWLQIFLLLGLCIGGWGVSVWCQETPKEAFSSADSKDEGIQQKVLSFNLEGFSEKGDKKWEIQGESAEAMREDKIKLKNIVAKNYGDEAEAVLQADSGIYDKANNNVLLQENVKVTVANTPKLMKEYVDFPALPAPQKVEDAKEALARRSGLPPSAGPSKKKDVTTITCDGDVVFNYSENRAHFERNVKVASEDGEIEADKITVYLDMNTKKIKEVVAEGDVKITRGENVTYSDKATYIESEKKVILTGQPKLVLYGEGDMQEQFFK